MGNKVLSETEYIENLKECTEKGLLCLEYHRRHKKRSKQSWEVKRLTDK